MSVDNSKTDSNFDIEDNPRLNDLSLNERLYACDEYRTEISAYLRALQVKDSFKILNVLIFYLREIFPRKKVFCLCDPRYG